MPRNITVNLFDASWTESKTQDLEDSMHEFGRLKLADRWRDDIRLDDVQQHHADAIVSHPAFHLCFAKSRSVGPGKMAQSTAIEDVGLRRDELFGEETAALYLPTKKWLLVLNNHYGVGSSRMASYFNALDPGNSNRHFDYQFSPRIDSAALAKMKAMRHFSSVEIVANVGAFEAVDSAVGEAVFDVAGKANAMRLTLRLDANLAYKKGGSLNQSKIRSLLSKLMRNGDEVDKLQVKGGTTESADSKDKWLNLIEERIRRQYPETELDAVNHRYTFQSKIRLLRRACRGWLTTMG